MESPPGCPQTDKKRMERERKMEACGGRWRGWLGVMDGNVGGDESEKGGVKRKTEGYLIVTLVLQAQ